MSMKSINLCMLTKSLGISRGFCKSMNADVSPEQMETEADNSIFIIYNSLAYFSCSLGDTVSAILRPSSQR